MVTGPEDGDHVISLLGQTKELRAEPLFYFSCGFVGEGEGHNLCDGQGVWLSQEEVEDAIDEDRGLAGPGSRNYHDITVPGGLRQEPTLGVSECQYITHHLLSAFSTGVRLGPGAIGKNKKLSARDTLGQCGERLSDHVTRVAGPETRVKR